MQHLTTLFKQGIDQGLHLGVQAYVSIESEPIAQIAIGTRNGVDPLTSQTPMLWMSAGKPLTAVAIAQLVEMGELDWDDRVGMLLQGFDCGGKSDIQLRHLLSHCSAIQEPQHLNATTDWDSAQTAVCQANIKPGTQPGTDAAYSPHANWTALGGIIERVTAQPFNQYIKQAVLEPSGCQDTWPSFSEQEYQSIASSICTMFDTARLPQRTGPVALPLHQPQVACQIRPGSNTFATATSMGLFYEMLLKQGTGIDGHSVLEASTIQTITQRQRVNHYDGTFRHVIDFGYGFVLNSYHHGPDTVPYGYGPHTSEQTFGHSGSQSTVCFADPQSQLVVAIAANGMPGEPRHQKRLRSWMQAIHMDLHM